MEATSARLQVEQKVGQLQALARNEAELPKAMQGFLARNPQQRCDSNADFAWRVNWEERWITNYPDPRP